jgi:hypothetical protein
LKQNEEPPTVPSVSPLNASLSDLINGTIASKADQSSAGTCIFSASCFIDMSASQFLLTDDSHSSLAADKEASSLCSAFIGGNPRIPTNSRKTDKRGAVFRKGCEIWCFRGESIGFTRVFLASIISCFGSGCKGFRGLA